MAKPPVGVTPMLATLAKMPAAALQSRYGYELKWDGYRALVRWDGRRLTIVSRNGNDLTAEFPECAGMAKAFKQAALIDGEIVAMDASGRPSFSLLQQRMPSEFRGQGRRTVGGRIIYIAFDVLWLGDHATTALPYVDRRALLERLSLAGPHWQTPPWSPDGKALLALATEQHLEGIVAKRLDSPYRPGRRTDEWLKVKLTRRDEFVVGGYLRREDPRQGLGALLLGYYRDDADARAGRLRYAGKVGTGFSDSERARLKHRCDEHIAEHRPFSDKTPHDRVAIWTQPTLVVEVQYAEWTHDLRVRHASYKGLRVDKHAGEVVTSPA